MKARSGWKEPVQVGQCLSSTFLSLSDNSNWPPIRCDSWGPLAIPPNGLVIPTEHRHLLFVILPVHILLVDCLAVTIIGRKPLLLHQRHHVWRIAFSGNSKFSKASVGLLQIIFGELHRQCTHVVFQITNPLCTRNRNHIVPLSQHPSQSKLCRCTTLLRRQFLYRISQFDVVLQRLLGEPRIGPPPVGRIKIRYFLDRPSQKPATQRTVRHETNPKFTASRENAVCFHFAGPK